MPEAEPWARGSDRMRASAGHKPMIKTAVKSAYPHVRPLSHWSAKRNRLTIQSKMPIACKRRWESNRRIRTTNCVRNHFSVMSTST